MHVNVPVLAAIVAVGLGLAAILRGVSGRLGSKTTGGGAYELRKWLLSPAERSFLGVLDRAVGGDYRIFAKVRVADIVQPGYNPSRSG